MLLAFRALAAWLLGAHVALAAPQAPTAAQKFETIGHAFAAAITRLCLPAVTAGREPNKARIESAGFRFDEGRVGAVFYNPTPEERLPATPFSLELGEGRVWGWVNGRACAVRANGDAEAFTRAKEALRGAGAPWARALDAQTSDALKKRQLELDTAIDGQRLGLDLSAYAGPAWPSGQWTPFAAAHVARKSWDGE